MGARGKNKNEQVMKNNAALIKFVGDQLSRWPMACDNFRALKNVKVREMNLGGLMVKLQFNPARMISSAAKLDKKDIAKRRCFLCSENRPENQIKIQFDGRKGKKYHILINPYPIFPDHLVIAADKHTDQSILHRYVDMLDMARKYDSFTFFYNGPRSGASAPDHHHFQAAPNGLMPLCNDVNEFFDGSGGDYIRHLVSANDAHLYHYQKFTTGVFVIRSETAKSAAKLFYRLLDCADMPDGESEPLFNLFSYWTGTEYRTIIVFRSRHRSHHYFSEGPDHLTMSPGCADMGGVFIVPVAEEYEKVTTELMTEMLSEVSITTEAQAKIINRLVRRQPLLHVGVMSSEEISFEVISDGAGPRKAVYKDGKVEYDGALYDELYFEAQTPSSMFAEPSFILKDVTIGINFHWERKEVQKFAGALKIIVDGERLTAINVVGVEDYLLSVISSEMSSSASEEFLKAHAVISRSWVMAQIEAARVEHAYDSEIHQTLDDSVIEYVKWYDHEDHHIFDVCADDHCQRYQGLTRAVGKTVRKVIDATWGQTLIYEGELCDARFSKCCGGVMEEFGACWAEEDKPYLRALPDTPGHEADSDVFCNTQDKLILAQVLNSYDQETVDFYCWKESYTKSGLSELITRRSGIDIGEFHSMEVLERGKSYRCTKLRINGSLKTLIVGKELEIRRILSESHLKSSAFDVVEDGDNVCLEGRGWGHGVGLCQIGAAVMASKGYDYTQILSHYYPGTELNGK